VRESAGKENDMWELEVACMHPDAVFVSGIPGRVSTGDTGHKIRRYLGLEDATGNRFLHFLSTVRRLGDATGDALSTVAPPSSNEPKKTVERTNDSRNDASKEDPTQSATMPFIVTSKPRLSLRAYVGRCRTPHRCLQQG
jgi:hypothetical protein